ncbi:MAG: hypothetical protein IJS39_06760 [Synergistaceae bacterium]|nr:hypothetical protein [Synergistaceae bacterium]
MFDKIAASNFMRESAAQKANWLTIDWPLNETNLVKILEGKYDNDRPRKAQIHRDAGTNHAPKLSRQQSDGSLMKKYQVH